MSSDHSVTDVLDRSVATCPTRWLARDEKPHDGARGESKTCLEHPAPSPLANKAPGTQREQGSCEKRQDADEAVVAYHVGSCALFSAGADKLERERQEELGAEYDKQQSEEALECSEHSVRCNSRITKEKRHRLYLRSVLEPSNA